MQSKEGAAAIVHPHDKAFKTAMEDIRVARDFLEHHLPEKIRTVLDFSALKIENPSFIEKDLQSSSCDILYQLKLKETKQIAYIYILIEHQSKPDFWLPFRQFKYICSGYDHHRSQYPADKKLPVIIPLIFYTGTRPYNYSLNFFDLFGENKELAIESLISGFRMIDINQIPDEIIKEYRWDRLLCMVMKHVKHRDLLLKLEEIVTDGIVPLLIKEGDEKYILSMITYLIEEGDVIETDQFFRMIQLGLSKHPLAEKKIMTIAERLRQEGRQEAEKGFMTIAERLRQEGRQEAEKGFMTIAERLRQEGRQEAEKGFMTIAERLKQEGRQEGRQEGFEKLRVVAKELLKAGNDPDFVSVITAIPKEKIEELL